MRKRFFATSSATFARGWFAAMELLVIVGFSASCKYPSHCESVFCSIWPAALVFARPRTLPDTGQTTCATTAGAVISCAGTGQDAEYATPGAYILYETTLGNAVGEVLGSDLLWQKCSFGQTGNSCAGTALSTVTRTQAFAACSGVAIADRVWRLPSAREMHLLPYFGGATVAMPSTFFPNTASGTNVYHWTSTTVVASPANSYLFAQKFGFFASQSNALATDTFARCVAGPAQPTQDYVRLGVTEPSVRDNTTGLTWTVCALKTGGAADTSANCAGPAPANFTQTNALTFCESLVYGGFTDWRLPNVRELASLMDYTQSVNPTVNQTYFTANPSATVYWSSTNDISNAANAYIFDVSDGTSGTIARTASIGDVRCVRGPW